MNNQNKALMAEFIGAFALIFVGAGAGAVSGSLVAVAFAHGLVVLGFAYAFGDISGTHLNPAVTIGLLVAGKIESAKAIGYIVVQILGAIVAAFALKFTLGSLAGSLGATVPAENVSAIQALLMETILTFIFFTVIYHTAARGAAGNHAPIAIGLTLVFAIMAGGNVSGASLNPARTIGPALAMGNFSSIWVYLIGPPLGAALAAIVAKMMD